ncbi:MAG: hypothetical protein H6760_04220 [Candidatus Nomurabacteria bacterium]|nr:MAG: hypothetical protein H6760_04220 [Candidatus Nomurabacteria bacterium]
MTILQGLKKIDAAGLPHPEWQFVRSSKELRGIQNIDAYRGWTIRTVEVRGGPWKNLYANWVAPSKVAATVDRLQREHPHRALFVVYPSWKWKKGGTILLERDRVVIEATRGPIVNLMRYGKVTASYTYQKGKLTQSIGLKKFLSPAEKQRILLACRMPKKGLILEWGISTQGKFIFYRVEDIREAARLLLAKYG